MSGMAQHIAVLPVLVPLIAAAVLVVLHRSPLGWRRFLSFAATLVMGLVVAGLALAVEAQGLLVYQVGNWPSAVGIVFLADRLSVLMLALLVLLALASQLFAAGAREDAGGLHFHGLFQLQLAGLAGAFLTHDLFNLFVFFEVLLAASYGLLLHGQGGERLRQGFHYVVLNLVASSLFLLAVGVFYGVLGTVNLSDLSARIAAAPAEAVPLLRAAALLLLAVFALKGAILPLYFWLPRTYAAAPASAAILFAIMTKLGLYALLRVYGLLAGDDAGVLSPMVGPVLFWAGAGTVLLAALGALAAAKLRPLLGYLVVGSAGVLAMAFGLGSVQGVAAGLFYLVHSTLAMAAFFLLADWVRRTRRGGDALERVGAMPRVAMMGGLFLVLAVAAAGLPPLGGFLGKALLLAYAEPVGQGAVLWSVVLVASFLTLLALARAGSRLFWQGHEAPDGTLPAPPPAAAERLALLLLLSALLGVAVQAATLTDYVAGSAAQLAGVEHYREVVLGRTPLPTTVPN